MVLNARTIMVEMGAPGVVRLVMLVLLGIGSAVLVWRSWMVAKQEAALEALVPVDGSDLTTAAEPALSVEPGPAAG